MTAPADLLRIRGLSTQFATEEGQINAVKDISLTIGQGEIVSIVGESGSGKSVTGRSLMDLIEPPGTIVSGEIWYRSSELAATVDDEAAVDGEYADLRALPAAIRQSLRGTAFSIIFQDPGSSFNSSLTVGRQIAEAVEANRRIAEGKSYGTLDLLRDIVTPNRSFVSEESYDRAVELLERVDIPDPANRAEEYPHQFSGGMLQRAMIAQALAADPTFLVADEPTTGLDVTIQSGIMGLLQELQRDLDMSILLITHNLGVVSRLADRTAVMYGGELFEVGPTEKVLNEPANPYTKGLLNSLPDVTNPSAQIEPITGNVPSLLDHEMPVGCSFADRCPAATDACRTAPPPVRPVNGDATHRVACVHAGSDGSGHLTEPVESGQTMTDIEVPTGVGNE